MITINSKGKYCVPDEDVFIGFTGDNLNVKREFFVQGVTDPTAIYRIYLLFDDGTSNFFLLDKEIMEEGTKLVWNIESDHIFKSGIVILQVKGTNGEGKIFHTSQVSLVVQKSIEFSESYNTVGNSEFIQHEKELNGIAERIENIKSEAEELYQKIKDADVDTVPTENSTSPVSSGGVYTALREKLDDAENSVMERNLADNSVTTNKIMNNSISFEKLSADTMIDKSTNIGMALAFANDSHIPTTAFVKNVLVNVEEDFERSLNSTEERVADVEKAVEKISGDLNEVFTKEELLVNLSSFKNPNTGEYLNKGRYAFNNTTKQVTITTDDKYACIPVELKAGTYTVQNIRSVFSFYVLNGEAKRFADVTETDASITTTFDLPVDTILYITIKVNTTATGYETVAIAKGDTIPKDITKLGLVLDTVTKLESVKALEESKQDKLTAGANITIDENNVISVIEDNILTVKKDSSGDFTTLKEAVEYSQLHKDLTIKVYEGTYDLIEEFGDEYFENLVGPSQRQGLQIGNGVHLIFSSGAKVVCNYQGDNDIVKTCFSPFNFAQNTSGFTLENLTLECSNVRYAVHDEGGSHNTPDMYRNIYKNCKMTIDNSNNTNWKKHQCIGGGLGLNGEIIIENCSFTDMYNVGAKVATVSYHNAVTEGAKSRIVVTGCYFSDNATFRLSYYGNSTEITEAFVSNCSMTHEPYVTAESGAYSIENVKLTQWNNEIRNK